MHILSQGIQNSKGLTYFLGYFWLFCYVTLLATNTVVISTEKAGIRSFKVEIYKLVLINRDSTLHNVVIFMLQTEMLAFKY